MTELRALDTGFIELEDADRRISLGIAVVAILDGPPPPRAAFTVALGRRLDGMPRLKQRVHRAPLDVTAPQWEDDPAFDLAHHIRWTALPRPGDEKTLWELVATEIEERLDRDHPLWQCVVVEGLAENRWALVLKAHHSLVDGISGVAVFANLCDPAPAGAGKRVPARPAHRPPKLSSLLKLPVSVPGIAFDTVRRLVPIGAAVVEPGPVSSLNGPIGHRRRYTAVRVSLPMVADIAAKYRVTVNDVVLAAITAGYRDLLLRREETPIAHGLRILVPVSMRAEHAKYVLDNRVSAVLPYLPIDRTDAVDRLRVIHTTMQAQKSGGAAGAEHTILGLAQWLPFAAVAWTLRLATRFPQRGIAALATNVPGPRHELTLQGHRVLELVPAVPIAMRLRTAIAILSYHDHLVFGITGDYDTAPDIDVLADGIRHAVGELAGRAGRGGDFSRRPDRAGKNRSATHRSSAGEKDGGPW
ncbi:wax ester/triacylglycerol synthase family O-acyltransferase [Nocardia sp. NPDC051750]|uniref:wax ester/triacylglycerol synthase family O-acyltransferase n=1 Tax=Nocardia sp. NPDC051750 TaxID=3364325 RepID=UPI0037B9491E